MQMRDSGMLHKAVPALSERLGFRLCFGFGPDVTDKVLESSGGCGSYTDEFLDYVRTIRLVLSICLLS